MGSGFSDFLDNIEKKMTTVERVEPKQIEPKHKAVKSETVNRKIEESIVVTDDTLKTRIISELNKFGLNDNAINEIVSNVFRNVKTVVSANIKPSSFKESVKSLNNTKVESVHPIDHASMILDGLEDPEVPQLMEQNNFMGSNQVSIKDFNMNSTAEHASALL